jgi:hypothetical protein
MRKVYLERTRPPYTCGLKMTDTDYVDDLVVKQARVNEAVDRAMQRAAREYGTYPTIVSVSLVQNGGDWVVAIATT